MSFNSEVLKPGRGRALLVEGSTDNFATITYRWGGVAGELGGPGTMYQNRVVSMAPIRRGLGQNRMAVASTTQVVLDNADGALDALVGNASMSTQAKLRFRLWLDVYDLQSLPADLSANRGYLGTYSLSTWIRQDGDKLTLALADDVMGAVSQQVALPTLLDWQAVGTTATNPIKTAMGIPNAIADFSPIQLAFGEDWVLALPHIIPWQSPDAAYIGTSIIPVCATADTGGGSTYEISQLRISYLNRVDVVQMVDVPTTFTDWNTTPSTSKQLWRTERSPTITKNGKSFKIIYLVVSNQGMNNFLSNLNQFGFDTADNRSPTAGSDAVTVTESHAYDGGYPLGAVDWAGSYYKAYTARVGAWFVKGFPLSAKTQQTVAVQHPVDVITDLVSYYSNNTAITVNATAAARAKAATRMAAAAGVVQGWTQGPKKGDPIFQQPPSLREIITKICQSSDIDCFIAWDGSFSFASDFWDFRIASSGTTSWSPTYGTETTGDGTTTAYSPTVIPETWIVSLERWLPSDGERWAPFNRLWFQGAKASPADGRDVPFQGPWDFDTGQPGAIALADRIIEATYEQGWRPFRQQVQAPWYWRTLNTIARDMVRFQTHIAGLQLELGQYFALSWTRGPTLGSPYLGAIFQCEGIVYDPSTDTVEVTAVWRDDITTEQQYLLDDETLLVRSKGALTGVASVDAGDNFRVNFGGTINLSTMGVVAGDILVLRYSGEAADVFDANLTGRIVVVHTTQQVELSASLIDNSYSIPNAEWSILRGATTYPTAVSDPTNYPLGGDMYGKTTKAGVYSNASAGNRLNSG